MDIVLRKRSALLGAFVADAASLGYHWLYDPEHLAKLAGNTPEFQTPNEADYENVSGYFAHPGKQSGELTHYGEQLWVALKSLSECKGSWNVFHYQATFAQTFERGGSFSGYVDGSTNGTLDYLKSANQKLLKQAVETFPGLGEKEQEYTVKYTEKLGVTKQGSELKEAIGELIEMISENKEAVDIARSIAEYYDQNRSAASGADDNQIPAFSKVPAVLAACAGEEDSMEQVEQAIRVTNNNDEAVAYGLYAARVLEQVILGMPTSEALSKALNDSSDTFELHEKISKALKFESLDPEKLAEAFGMPCPMPQTIPLSVAILNQTSNYKKAVRTNILAGGDNAGRSIFVGSVLGAAQNIGSADGIPLSWISQIDHLKEITLALDHV